MNKLNSRTSAVQVLEWHVFNVYFPPAPGGWRTGGSDLQQSSVGQIRMDTQDHRPLDPVQLHQRHDRHMQSHQLHEQKEGWTPGERQEETRPLDLRQELINTHLFDYSIYLLTIAVFDSGNDNLIFMKLFFLTYWT